MDLEGLRAGNCVLQRYHHYSKGPGGFQPSLFVVSLRVGTREFLGEGPTPQAARHDAASKALHQLKSLPMPEDTLQHCDAGIQENGEYFPVLSLYTSEVCLILFVFNLIIYFIFPLNLFSCDFSS